MEYDDYEKFYYDKLEQCKDCNRPLADCKLCMEGLL